MSAGGLYTDLNKGSLILFNVGKKLGLNSHNFICIATEFSLWSCQKMLETEALHENLLP